MKPVTSSFCNFGDCVEVELNASGRVVASSSVTGSEVSFSAAEWEAFIAGVKAGEFDLDRLRAVRDRWMRSIRRSSVTGGTGETHG